jgi:hypothetical protein
LQRSCHVQSCVLGKGLGFPSLDNNMVRARFVSLLHLPNVITNQFFFFNYPNEKLIIVSTLDLNEIEVVSKHMTKKKMVLGLNNGRLKINF